MVDLSIIIPFYNEVDNLPDLHQQICSIFKSTKYNIQIVYVNDGSTDSSIQSLKKAVRPNKNKHIEISLVNLRRNSGQTAALAAGMDNAKGLMIAFMDADLQNDPRDLLLFIHRINEGFDAVFGWRKARKDDAGRTLISKIANWSIRFFFKFPFHDVGCALKVVRRDVLKDLQLYGESHRILPVIIFAEGYKCLELPVIHRQRLSGKSKYGYTRIFKLIIDLITIKFLNSYGTKPAYVFGSVGLLSNFLGILCIATVLYRKLALGVFVHRDPLFLIAIFLIILGVQFILMGLIAELLVRTYFESQKKPIYKTLSIEKL